MGALDSIALKIISEQALVIGPLAWSEAGKVQGLSVDATKTEVSVEGNSTEVIDRLVAQYERLFGRASHEVCREAVANLVASMSHAEIPASLR